MLALFGMCVWFFISLQTGKKEAWDTDIFWSYGFFAMIFGNAVAGFLDPENIILKGLLSVSLMPVAMLIITGEIGSMFPMGLIVFALLGLIYTLGGIFGARIKKKFFSEGV